MNNTINRIAVVLLLFVTLFTTACREDLGPIDKPSDFTKEKREDLTKSKTGKIVNKKRSLIAKKNYNKVKNKLKQYQYKKKK